MPGLFICIIHHLYFCIYYWSLKRCNLPETWSLYFKTNIGFNGLQKASVLQEVCTLLDVILYRCCMCQSSSIRIYVFLGECDFSGILSFCRFMHTYSAFSKIVSWIRGAKLSHGTDTPAQRQAIETNPRFGCIQELQAVGADWKHACKTFSAYNKNTFPTSNPSNITGWGFDRDFYWCWTLSCVIWWRLFPPKCLFLLTHRVKIVRLIFMDEDNS